jgi:hypothetical protein
MSAFFKVSLNSDHSNYRLNIVKTLTALSGNSRPISDTEILKWANAKVATQPGAKTVRSFKDPSLSTGVWFLHLLNALKPGIVDDAMVAHDANDFESKKQNGRSVSLGDVTLNSNYSLKPNLPSPLHGR